MFYYMGLDFHFHNSNSRAALFGNKHAAISYYKIFRKQFKLDYLSERVCINHIAFESKSLHEKETHICASLWCVENISHYGRGESMNTKRAHLMVNAYY
jgi:hypothetical protein